MLEQTRTMKARSPQVWCSVLESRSIKNVCTACGLWRTLEHLGVARCDDANGSIARRLSALHRTRVQYMRYLVRYGGPLWS